jgi:predicted ATP-dependent serine protease
VEIRGASQTETGLKEAVKMGFSRGLISSKGIKALKSGIDLELVCVPSVQGSWSYFS